MKPIDVLIVVVIVALMTALTFGFMIALDQLIR